VLGKYIISDFIIINVIIIMVNLLLDHVTNVLNISKIEINALIVYRIVNNFQNVLRVREKTALKRSTTTGKQ